MDCVAIPTYGSNLPRFVTVPTYCYGGNLVTVSTYGGNLTMYKRPHMAASPLIGFSSIGVATMYRYFVYLDA
jgi:hypothetical protein